MEEGLFLSKSPLHTIVILSGAKNLFTHGVILNAVKNLFTSSQCQMCGAQIFARTRRTFFLDWERIKSFTVKLSIRDKSQNFLPSSLIFYFLQQQTFGLLFLWIFRLLCGACLFRTLCLQCPGGIQKK